MPTTVKGSKKKLNPVWDAWNDALIHNVTKREFYRTHPAKEGKAWSESMVKHHQKIIDELIATEPPKRL
jgi:hypothetical protein